MIFNALFGRKSKEEDPLPLDSEGDPDSPIEDAPMEDASGSEDPAGDTEDSPDADKEAQEKDQQDRILREMNLRARTYEKYNQRKLRTIEERLIGLDRDIFRILPALVHLNSKGLPGYIEERERVPGGIWNHRVRKDIIDFLKKMFPDADYRPLSLRKVGVKNQIYSLSAMGSLATIAQTSKSDFDIWVCVKKEKITDAQMDGFKEKLKALEEWAEDLSHFECHFFITDIDSVKINNFGSADKESAGSALGKLLKEEFYRTYTVLAGHFPFWALMPPNISLEEYEDLRTMAIKSRKIERGNYIDMGAAQRITMEEAFGAALWQLNKALGSPFKSAMKMALIEDYMDKATDPVLLCDRLKVALTEIQDQRETEEKEAKAGGSEEEAEKPKIGKGRGRVSAEPKLVLLEEDTERTNIDGYNLMFNRIQDYYRRTNQEENLDVLRKCFYLKAGTSITNLEDPARSRYPLKDMLGQIVQSWGWTNDEVVSLNNYEKWSFDERVALGKQVNNFIIDSYKRLKKMGAESNVQINETDMTVLGRKLFTFFSKKENKIGFLPKSFEEGLRQERITLSFVKPEKKMGVWKVYPGTAATKELEEGTMEDQVLKSSYSLPEILFWLVLNGIWTKDTDIALIARESPLSTAEVQDVLFFMTNFFPPAKVDALDNKDLLVTSKVERVLAILNYGMGDNVKKVGRLEVIHSTSWGELFYERAPTNIRPGDAVQFCLNHLPRFNRGSAKPPLDRIGVYVPSARAGKSSNVRIFQSFEKAIHKSAKNRYEKIIQQMSARAKARKVQAAQNQKSADPNSTPPKAPATPKAAAAQTAP